MVPVFTPTLSVHHGRDGHTATLELADGYRREGMSAPTEDGAVHNVFEDYCGKPLARPAANHMKPITRATIMLCGVATRLAELEDKVDAQLAGTTLQADALADIHGLLGQVQATVDYASRLFRLTEKVRADKYAGTMLQHPLFDYAEEAVFRSMSYSKRMLEQLGIPNAITGAFAVNLDLTPEESFAAFTPGWPSAEAETWWEDRAARTRQWSACRDTWVAEGAAADGPQRHITQLTQICRTRLRERGVENIGL